MQTYIPATFHKPTKDTSTASPARLNSLRVPHVERARLLPRHFRRARHQRRAGDEALGAGLLPGASSLRGFEAPNKRGGRPFFFFCLKKIWVRGWDSEQKWVSGLVLLGSLFVLVKGLLKGPFGKRDFHRDLFVGERGFVFR